MRYTVLVYTLTQIVMELGVSEPVARAWMFRTRFIMHLDALERQKSIVFGRAAGGLTTEIECDETCVSKWKEQPAEDDPDQRMKFHWYVWFGFKQRGSLDKLWLKCMGVRTSREKAVIPQISKQEYLECLDQANFCEATAAVMHTDSAATFVSTSHPGIADQHYVNHGENEYVRSVEILANTLLGQHSCQNFITPDEDTARVTDLINLLLLPIYFSLQGRFFTTGRKFKGKSQQFSDPADV